MLTTSYFLVKSAFSSTFTLPTLIFPAYSLEISSTIGDKILHGPHQTAQKSIKTGWFDFNTSWSKFASVIIISAIFFVISYQLAVISYSFILSTSCILVNAIIDIGTITL